ncbi:hydroxyisourate hydrolase [Luteipulveratus mongoliensis]|uniref:5-hydroxyisourate hydrolase n=1 Tax=Luteipulveratus mongoliensis TaxID=571913 RepID=A0A0K1JP13_9MICO|nr:hydroxyisourate hydrolase [Luteipulveratus mongoliensis]AKU18457.1 5-hydroxyisourate hydrolase [Luteipulveratus mongoliensis]
MSSLSTHVLDAVGGSPAVGVQVSLYAQHESGWQTTGSGTTDGDGRVASLADGLASGTYRLVFATGDYFARAGTEAFYPEVVVSFVIEDERHYHVPLLLSPFAYSTYRGS